MKSGFLYSHFRGMNMKTNLPQHPCANKCSNFKDEQCNTCLVQQIEKREFDLGLAPDEAYVKNQKFLSGDVVVYMNHIKIDDLQTVEAYQPVNFYWLECGQLAHESDIRMASVTELLINRRLTESEQALAEVS